MSERSPSVGTYPDAALEAKVGGFPAPPAALISAATSPLSVNVASHGTQPQHRYTPSPVPVRSGDGVDDDWSPTPSPTRLWDQDWH